MTYSFLLVSVENSFHCWSFYCARKSFYEFFLLLEMMANCALLSVKKNWLQNTSVTLRWTGGLISLRAFSNSYCTDIKPRRVFNMFCRCSEANMETVFVTEGMQEVVASYFSPGNLIQTTLLLSQLTRNVPLCYPSPPPSSPPHPRRRWGLLVHTALGSDNVWTSEASTGTLLDEDANSFE